MFARILAGESRRRMQAAIGFAFLLGGLFYAAFGGAHNFALALLLLFIAHMGGSILWVFSTVLLQGSVEDNFRGRVFAAELALLTLALAASNYATGELLDRCQVSPRTVTVMIGALFLVPGLLWFATARWWNREREPARAMTKLDTEAAALHDVAKQIHLSAD